MSSKIKSIPDLNDEIKDAINNKKLIIFIGAGVSALAGLPLWNDLADNLINCCIKNKLLNHKEANVLFSDIKDAKKKISIVFEIFKKNKQEAEFYNVLSEQLECEEVSASAKTIFEFCQWSNATVLTTNADTLLDKYFDKNLIYSDLSNFKFTESKPSLYKIHGSITNESTLVFTSEQYIRRYSNEDFKNFLISIFDKEYTVLFMGYGMSEFELLEHIVKLGDKSNGNVFFMSPFYTNQKSYCEYMDMYYKSMNIKLIPYSLDKNSYSQLSLIIKRWKREIENTTKLTENKVDIKSYIDDKDLNSILQIMNTNEFVKSRFVSLVKDSEYLDWWVENLTKKEFFNPENVICKNKNVYYSELELINYYLSVSKDEQKFNIVKSKVIELIEYVKKHPKYLSEFNLIFNVFDLLLKFPENILQGDELHEFIKKIYKNTFKNISVIINGLVNNVNNLKKWNSNDIESLFKTLISLIDFNSTSEYYLQTLYKNVFCKLVDKLSNDIFDALVQLLCKEEKRHYNFCFLESFSENVSEKSYRYRNLNIVINMTKELAKKNKFDADKYIDAVINSDSFSNESRIKKMLCIYLISNRFNEYKESFLSLKYNIFNELNIHKDLYCLIENNLNNLTYDECSQLYSKIYDSYINGYKGFIVEYLQLFVTKYDSFNLKLIDMSAKINTLAPVADNSNNQSYNLQDTENKDIVEYFSSVSFKEMIDYLAEVKPSYIHIEQDYEDAFEKIISSDLTILKDNIELINVYPQYCMLPLIKIVEEYLKSNDFTTVKNILDKVYVSTINNKDNHYFLSYLTNELITLSEHYSFNPKFKNFLLNFAFDIINSLKNEFNSELSDNSDNIEDILGVITNDCFCSALTLAIKIMSICKINKLSDIMNIINELDGTAKFYAKCVAVYNLDSISNIDESLADQIVIDFIDDYKTADLFMYCGYKTLDAFNHLKEIGYFDYVFDYSKNSDTNIISMLISQNILYYVSSEYFALDLIPKLSECKRYEVYYPIFEQIKFMLENSCARNKINECLVEIFKSINASISNGNISSSDNLMGVIASFIATNKINDDYVWDTMVNLSLKFNGYISESLKNLLLEAFDTQKKNVVSIIENIVKSKDAYIFNYSNNYDELILKIKNDFDLSVKFNELNSILIQKNICKFIDA